jgi:uncharacterized membrane protein YphA (DoxX/SURF4 family)
MEGGFRGYLEMTMLTALGLLLLRVVIGLTLAAHGAQKLFGWWGGSGMSGWVQAVTRLRIRPAAPSSPSPRRFDNTDPARSWSPIGWVTISP